MAKNFLRINDHAAIRVSEIASVRIPDDKSTSIIIILKGNATHEITCESEGHAQQAFNHIMSIIDPEL